MKLRTFQANDMREALQMVKTELGPEAMIVATRPLRRGLLGTAVEVTAAIDDEDPAAKSPPTAPTLPERAAGLTDQDVERIMAPLRSELRTLKTQLRPLGNGMRDREIKDEIAEIRRLLLATSKDSRGLREAAERPALRELAKRRSIARPPEKRVVALIGPTGVGKTTTIAKLAARASLLESRSVTVVSVDTYRVGGAEQIRIFADLMGVPLKIVHDLGELQGVVRGLHKVDRVFIDTAGRSPRDERAICELVQNLVSLPDLEIHLTLAAGTPSSAIHGWANRYGLINIDRLIFTKIDETDDLRQLVEAPANLERPVSYVTNGQRVPEDIETATTERLVELAGGNGSQEEAA